MANKNIEALRVVDHGLENSQYFQGHGVSFTSFDTTFTGVGDTFYDALEDALEQLHMTEDKVDTEAVETLLKEELGVEDLTKLEGQGPSAHEEIKGFAREELLNEHEESEITDDMVDDLVSQGEWDMNYYVSVDVKFANEEVPAQS